MAGLKFGRIGSPVEFGPVVPEFGTGLTQIDQMMARTRRRFWPELAQLRRTNRRRESTKLVPESPSFDHN